MSAVDDRVRERPPDSATPVESLIPEAKARARRRWARIALSLIVVCGCVAAAVVLIGPGAKRATSSAGHGSAGVLPAGKVVALANAGPLAVAPDGALYVADIARHRVLVRLHDGRFRVIAGDGRDGFSGDGGLATRAQLSTITDIAVSPSGDLYIADGGRIRVVGRDGIIRTVAGDGRPLPSAHRQPLAQIVAGTPALSAALGAPRAVSYDAPMIAFSPAGQLYISTGLQVVRLTARGTLTPIRAVVADSPLGLHGPLSGFGPLAVDRNGDIEVAGFNGWSVWQISPAGVAHEVGPGSGARRSGGGYSVLERAANGRVYAENGPELLEIDGSQLVPAHSFGSAFWLTYFAFAPDGGIYADEISGDSGFEARQQLREIRRGHSALLWEQPK